MLRLLVIPLTLILMVCGSLSAVADIYRWVDDNGNIQFSDRPASGKKSETIEIDTTRNSYGGGDVLNRQSDLLDRYQKQDQQAQKNKQQAALEKENQKRLKSKCLRAKDQLARYERGSLYTLDEQGERIYYSEEKRTQKIEAYRKSINTNCK
ncbi:MAG: DUF4124 domain-containing protein [Oleispira sp.]|nr:DUF4124 domain-containing protein [Oleispira sp.]MBL4880983.1 DUF4124 domain-containing protein [Oleispira sp.]